LEPSIRVHTEKVPNKRVAIEKVPETSAPTTPGERGFLREKVGQKYVQVPEGYN